MIGKSPKSENQTNAPAGTSPADRRLADARGARLYEVEIAGVPLRLKSLHDEQTVNELVALVDRKVRDALPLTKTGSIQNASILASLHLAEECLNLRHKAKVELERLESKALKVISELESSHVLGLQGKEERNQGARQEKNQSQIPDVSSEISSVDSSVSPVSPETVAQPLDL